MTDPCVVLSFVWNTGLGCDMAMGVIAYAQHHTRWRLARTDAVSDDELEAVQGDAVIGMLGSDADIRLLLKRGLPAVLTAEADDRIPWVRVDEAAVGRLAAEHLSALGLRQFAFLVQTDWGDFARARKAGFFDGLADLGHPRSAIRSLRISNSRVRVARERRLTEQLERLRLPCGFFAANDFLACEVVSAARRLGLRIPDDLAIIGVDNDELSQALSEVPITTILQPSQRIGYEAARLLDEQLSLGISAAEAAPRKLVLAPARVITRASTQRLAVEDPQVEMALQLIRDHIAEPIDVSWVVRQMPLSRRTLEQRFRRLVGRTLLEHIHHLRIEHAKAMLIDTDMTVESIAQRCGLRNARMMADHFRRYEGKAPSSFRQDIRPDDRRR